MTDTQQIPDEFQNKSLGDFKTTEPIFSFKLSGGKIHNTQLTRLIEVLKCKFWTAIKTKNNLPQRN